MAALKLFDITFYKHLRNSGRFCGVDVWDPNFRVTFHTLMCGASMVSGVLCLIYTLATKDFETGLNSLFGWGIAIQVCREII